MNCGNIMINFCFRNSYRIEERLYEQALEDIYKYAVINESKKWNTSYQNLHFMIELFYETIDNFCSIEIENLNRKPDNFIFYFNKQSELAFQDIRKLIPEGVGHQILRSRENDYIVLIINSEEMGFELFR